jgi:hypothetical protein
MLSGSSSSSGEVAKGVLMILPDDGNLGLCPNDAEPPPLGLVRCERKETDLLTLCPRSDTLEVRLNMLLSLLCPFMNLFLSLSSGTSSGGLSLPFRLSSVKIACSFAYVCFFPVNRPNTLEEVVEKEGIPAAASQSISIHQTCLLCQPLSGQGRLPPRWNSTCACETDGKGDL